MLGPSGMHGEVQRISLYVRVTSSLRNRLMRGEWKPGDKLPTLEEFSRQYGVARITVRQALQILATDGLVASGRGRGTVALPGARPPVDDPVLQESISDPLVLGPQQKIRVLRRSRVSELPPELTIERPVHDRLVRLRKLHLSRGTPFVLMDVYVAADLYARFPRGADTKTKLSRLVQDHTDVTFTWSRQEITITHADQATAALLACPIMAPLVRIRRWRADAANRIVYAALLMYRGDMFIYNTEVSAEAAPDHFRSHVVPGARRD